MQTPEPDVTPVPEAAPAYEESVVDMGPTPDPVVELEPEPDPVVELEPEPEPVLEISYPDPEEAPPGLSVDAFKDIKPVSFGGVTVEPSEPASYEPAPAPPAPDPEPTFAPEPTVEVEPEPVAPELEPVIELEPTPDPGLDFEPISFPEPVAEPRVEPEPEPEAEPAIAAAVAEPVAADEPAPKKRGLRLPNPELKLPKFGKKKAAAAAATASTPKAGRGLKLPQITLPPNLEGPLSDLERKIALGSMVAIFAAAALGYSTAPSDEAAAPAPTPAPAAASR